MKPTPTDPARPRRDTPTVNIAGHRRRVPQLRGRPTHHHHHPRTDHAVTNKHTPLTATAAAGAFRGDSNLPATAVAWCSDGPPINRAARVITPAGDRVVPLSATTLNSDRVVFDGDSLDEIVLTDAHVHLEVLDASGEHAMLVIDRGPVHLHMQVQYPTVVESEGAERITVRNPPLPQENQ